MKRTFTFRVDSALWEKLHIIAERNKRSANNQLEYLVENFVTAYEKQNGEISTEAEED